MNSYIDYLESLSKKQLMLLLARQRQEESQGIAIVGLGCRLPGGITSPERFWHMLRTGEQATFEWPEGPLDSLGRARWDLTAKDLAPMATLVRNAAYLQDPDLFDAEGFGISEQEALSMDPQQRLLLEVSRDALSDANLTRAELRGRRVGVFMALGAIEYPWLWTRSGRGYGEMTPYLAGGNVASAAAGRVGLAFGLSGPALTIDTSSSSVLVALHYATQALRRNECELALVGGCQLLLSPYPTGVLSRAGMLSEAGRCRPFSTLADGHVRAEGCGVLVLKRQSQAQADGDAAYAIVRGSALYQHGERANLAAASATGQRIVIELALRAANLEPEQVSYVEAQANGGRLAGIVEAEALIEAYGRASPSAPSLYVGSCKANIGYLETVSGAPALIKAALALKHAEIPAQLAAEPLDPSIRWGSLQVARDTIAWPSQARRCMGVSSFGLTGIAAHAILEASPPNSADGFRHRSLAASTNRRSFWPAPL